MLACSNAAPSETFKILKSAPNLNALAIAVSIRRPDTRTTPLVLVLVPAKQLRVAMSQMHEPPLPQCLLMAAARASTLSNVCSMSRYLPLFKLGIPANARKFLGASGAEATVQLRSSNFPAAGVKISFLRTSVECPGASQSQ